MFGMSKKRAKNLSFLAEHVLKTGEYVLPGVGKLVRVKKNVGGRFEGCIPSSD
jgi:hypothetical protein